MNRHERRLAERREAKQLLELHLEQRLKLKAMIANFTPTINATNDLASKLTTLSDDVVNDPARVRELFNRVARTLENVNGALTAARNYFAMSLTGDNEARRVNAELSQHKER